MMMEALGNKFKTDIKFKEIMTTYSQTTDMNMLTSKLNTFEEESSKELNAIYDKFQHTNEKNEKTYQFASHSMGKLPKSTINVMNEVVTQIEDFEPDVCMNKWPEVEKQVNTSLSKMIGASTLETIATSTLTTNIHQILGSFYMKNYDKTRTKVVVLDPEYSTDLYAV